MNIRKVLNLKTLGLLYFLIGIAFNSWWLCTGDYPITVLIYGFENSFMFLSFAIVWVSESSVAAWITLFLQLTLVALSIYFLIGFIRKKANFWVPLIITVLDVATCLVTFEWNNLDEYVGLLYKLLGCVIFICIIVGQRKEKKKLAEN